MSKKEKDEGNVLAGISILDLNLDSVPELQTMGSGSEAQLEITSFKLGFVGEKNLPVFKIALNNMASTDEAEYGSVFYTAWLPNSDDTTAQANRKRRDLVHLCTAFNIDGGLLADYLNRAQGVEVQDIPQFEEARGKTAYAILKETQYEGRFRNEVQRFVS